MSPRSTRQCEGLIHTFDENLQVPRSYLLTTLSIPNFYFSSALILFMIKDRHGKRKIPSTSHLGRGKYTDKDVHLEGSKYFHS